MAKLSPEQIQFYQDKGYIVVSQLFDFESLYSYKRRFLHIVNGIVPKNSITIFKEDALEDIKKKPEEYVNKIQDILYDDVFSSYVEDPRLLDVVLQLIGDELTAMHSMLINKPPGTAEHPPHQDLYYFPFRPADKIIAAWTAIDAVTVENGCLYVVPGSHKPEKLYAHDYTSVKHKMYHGILDTTAAPERARVNLEMSPGDTVLFHPYLVHGSRPNVSKNYRKSISCHFAHSRVQFIDVSGTVQDTIAKEVVEAAKKRGFQLSFEEVWKYRSKPVRGAVTLSHL